VENIMSEIQEQPAKPKRASRANSTIMARALRKILKQKVPNPAQPNSKEAWADKMGANLVAIASEKKNAVGLQAIKLVMDHVADPILVVAGGSEDSEPKDSPAALRGKSDEELEAELKELKERLGAIVTAAG
jgi:hypothetical protein